MRTLRLLSAAIVVVLVMSACGKALVKPDRSGQAGQSVYIAPSATAAPSGGGSCQIDFTGDLTKSWTGTQDPASITTSYWMTKEAITAAGLVDGDASMSFSCRDVDTNLVSIMTPSGTRAADFPQAPKKYVIPKLGLLGITPSGQLNVVLNLNDQALWSVAEEGTLEIKTFSAGRIEASFSVKLGKLSADLKSYTATVTLKGSFSLNCLPGVGSVCG
jgi:hypothetical protein